jgi:hypothetical protein
MGIIDDGKLQNILPKYSELKLSGKNLAQQYVSAFNTGMNIYQCINQLQGYIEWVIKAVNDVVVQWNEIVDKQIKYAINESVTASKQATTEQFNIEWAKNKAQLDVEIKGMVQDQFNIDWQERENAINLKITGVSNDLSNFKTETDTKFTTTKEELTSLINTTIDNTINTTIDNTINSIYPIGSVYISLTETNPGTYLKGIWEQFGQGRTLIGEGTGNDGSNTMNFTAGSTGGNYEHNHTYGIKLNDYYSNISYLNLRNSDGSWQEGVIDGRRNGYVNSACQENNKEINSQTFKIEANTSNSRTMHPYITVYFWKRVN